MQEDLKENRSCLKANLKTCGALHWKDQDERKKQKKNTLKKRERNHIMMFSQEKKRNQFFKEQIIDSLLLQLDSYEDV